MSAELIRGIPPFSLLKPHTLTFAYSKSFAALRASLPSAAVSLVSSGESKDPAIAVEVPNVGRRPFGKTLMV